MRRWTICELYWDPWLVNELTRVVKRKPLAARLGNGAAEFAGGFQPLRGDEFLVGAAS